MTTFADELAEFLAHGPSPDEIAAFRFSEAWAERLEDLIRRQKRDEATANERVEIESALALSHLVTLTKLRIARREQGGVVDPSPASESSNLVSAAA